MIFIPVFSSIEGQCFSPGFSYLPGVRPDNVVG